MAAFPQIPGYEIQAELGRGGMAVVYSAIEADLGRQVAIKIVPGEAGDPDGHIGRLENEARGLATLHHPHIVDLYRFGRTDDGGLYYVMPLLPGGSLEDRTRPMPEAQVVALLEHLLDALAHAHASDIIHRDIKPANILFDRHGRPLLADFGAAFMRKRDGRFTTHGGAIGSSGYMSPEQARGLEVDARSDLYSTAVLAFELLTGSRPWEGPDGLSIALAQLEQPVPRLAPALKHWQAFFDRALAVTPEHRFPSAGAMATAIRNLQLKKEPERKGHGLTIALVATTVLLVGVTLATWKPWRATGPGPAVGTSAPKFGDAAVPGETAASDTTSRAAPEEAADPANKAPTAVGDRFADLGGPPMVLARAANASRPALAVMAAPVDTPLYRRYLEQRKRKAVSCSGALAPAQGCLDLAAGNEIARWLSEETGEKYRVPTRGELEASIAQVVRANAYAWTDSCNEVRVYERRNAAQRGWARVRKVFGKPRSAPYELRCDGHFAIKLDGKGNSAQARGGAAADTVVVLVRDLPPKR